jgi:hypothetical protein
MQLVATIAVMVVGLVLATVIGSGDIRIFGWILVGVGVLGLLARWVIARLGGEGYPPTRR